MLRATQSGEIQSSYSRVRQRYQWQPEVWGGRRHEFTVKGLGFSVSHVEKEMPVVQGIGCNMLCHLLLQLCT